MIVIIIAVVVLAVAAAAGWRVVGSRSAQWERTHLDGDRWQLTNRTGAVAGAVKVEVKGQRIRGVDTGEVGDVAPDATVEVLTTIDMEVSEGGSPMVVVTWEGPGGGRRKMWAAPLKQ